jgi:Tfp pilus assembly protein PilV
LTLSRRNCAGSVLLEVMVALAVLGTIAAAATWKTLEILQAVRSAQAAEQSVRQANRLLNAVSLWPRIDLDRRLGYRLQGSMWMRIDRTGYDIYLVELQDTLSGTTILRTALFPPRD